MQHFLAFVVPLLSTVALQKVDGQKYSYVNFESEKIEKYELCPRCLESHCKSGWNLRGTQLCLKEETLCWLAASKIRWIRDIFRVWSFQRLAGVTGGRTVVWSTCTRGSTTGREARRTGIAVSGSRWQTVNNCFLHQKNMGHDVFLIFLNYLIYL